MQVSNIRFALLALLLLTRCGPSADKATTEAPAPQAAEPSAETIPALVARLDLERYKATSKGLTQFFEEEFTRLGGRVVAKEAYTQTDPDFKGAFHEKKQDIHEGLIDKRTGRRLVANSTY